MSEKRQVGQKNGLEVASAEFIADDMRINNGMIGSEEEEDKSSNSFDEIWSLSHDDNLLNDCFHLKVIFRKIIIPNGFIFQLTTSEIITIIKKQNIFSTFTDFFLSR